MTALTVRKLTLRAGDRRHFGAQSRLERALAGASLPDGKVYAVRRVPTIRYSSAQGPFETARSEALLARRVERTLGPLLADAVHGGRSDAANANAVWFADMAEAQALFIALVAQGKRPAAWFWRSLLGSEWHLPDPAQAVARQFGRLVEGRADFASLAGAFGKAVRLAGFLPVTQMLSRHAAFLAPEPGFASDGQVANAGSIWPGQEPAQTQRVEPTLMAVLSHIVCLAESAGVLAAAARERDAGTALIQASAALTLATERPDLLASPSLRHAVTEAAVAELHRFAAHRDTRPDDTRGPQSFQLKAADPAEPSARAQVKLNGDAGVISESGLLVPPAGAQSASPPAPVDDLEPAQSTVLDDHRSVPGAGLLLVVPSLVELGLPGWLARRPAWHLARFGQRLLLAIALHYRPGSTQDVVRILGLEGGLPLGPDTRAWVESERHWRVGLDRWLRRTCRVRLHDLARIDAPIVLQDEVWRCRFRLSQINLGLRRHALDRDPGWTPWLGLSLRYDYLASPSEEVWR